MKNLKIEYLTNSRGTNKSKDLLVITEEREDGTKTFDLFVYRTHIAHYDTKKMDNVEIADKWDYTRTTSKALYEFLQCYTFISYRTKGGYVNELFSDLMNAKNKKALIEYLINTSQVKIFNVDIVETEKRDAYYGY